MRPRFKSPAVQAQPTSSVSAPFARWIVTCTFSLLQLYKLANFGSGAFWKFCALDAAFLFVLSKMRIPRLSFRTPVFLAAFSLLALLNSLLFNRTIITQPISLLLGLAGRKVSVTGGRVRPESSRDIARNHLRGSYTVNFLPESLATLQIDEPVCIDGSLPSYFHLVLNNTAPQHISLAGKRFDNSFFTVEFDSRQIRKSLTKHQNGLTHIFLPINEPGLYRLGEVLDKSDANVKVQGPIIVVPPCPTVRITPPDFNTVCVEGQFAPLVSLTGIQPFHVVLANSTVFSVGTSANENSPKPETLTSFVRLDTRNPGLSSLEIVAVRDSLDNWSNTSIKAQVSVHAPPSILRTSPDNVPLLEGASATFKIDSNDFPVDLVYRGPDSGPGPEVLHTIKVNSNKVTLPLKQPGAYELVELRGGICSSGLINGPKKLTTFEPPETGLQVSFEQLKDKCSGPTGTNADLKFRGTPPFKVWYRTLVGSRLVHQDVLDSDSPENIITFKPGSIGTFKYQVTAVKDRYRKIDLQGQEFEQVQTIRELAGAQFLGGAKTAYCPGEPAFISAKVQGKGPLSLVYQVGKNEFTEENVQGDLTLNLGKLAGGKHRVTLKSITDVEGCTTPLEIHSPLLNVRSELAKIKFTGPTKLKVYDPRMELPLSISNAEKGPKRLKYSINGTEISTTLSGFKLPITQPGTYKLLEFNDGCPGVVGQEEIVVSVYERPSVELIENTPSICFDGASDETLQLKGEPPFKVWSEVRDPNGRVTHDVRDTINTRIKFSNKPRNIPGKWTSYYWLADKVYPKGDKSQSALVVTQTVWPEPLVMHTKPGAQYSLCHANGQHQGIPVRLEGTSPFVVTVELSSSKEKATTHRVNINHTSSKPYNLYEPFEKEGTFQVKLISVKDSRGCIGRPNTLSSIVHVKTVQSPKLEVDKHDYCVGEYISLKPKGSGATKLDYTLNKRKLSAQGKPNIKLLASKPGELQLLQLSDEASCPAKLNDKITVHDLPSSGITRQPSFNIHRDEEVELQFAFVGTAPFTFVYTRSVDGREVERHTVSDVKENKHSINVNENGVYEVVSLKDAYCSVSL